MKTKLGVLLVALAWIGVLVSTTPEPMAAEECVMLDASMTVTSPECCPPNTCCACQAGESHWCEQCDEWTYKGSILEYCNCPGGGSELWEVGCGFCNPPGPF